VQDSRPHEPDERAGPGRRSRPVLLGVVIPLIRSSGVFQDDDMPVSGTGSRGEPRDGGVESALVDDVVTGGPAALERLYDAYAPQSYALALRVLGDEALAQDAVQEAFLAFWKDPGTFDSKRGRLLTFLLTLVHRRSVDILRREGRQRRQNVPETVLLEIPDLDPGPAELAEIRIRADEVRQALAELPERQRRILTLAYFDGRSQREIAMLTGIPLGTVKTRMVAAVRALRSVLGDAAEVEVEAEA
jgi:RNA polymerase sigma factor (sigma-70 family)